MTREQFTERVAFDMGLEALMRERDIGQATEQAMREYYEARPDRFDGPERVDVLTIAARVRRDPPPEEEAEALELLRGLSERARAGEDFATLAMAHSQGPRRGDGGSMGWIDRERSRYDADVLDAIFALSEGDVSEPLRTRIGYQIFTVRERLPAGVAPFESVRGELRELVERRLARVAEDELLTELGQEFDVRYIEAAYGLEETE